MGIYNVGGYSCCKLVYNYTTKNDGDVTDDNNDVTQCSDQAEHLVTLWHLVI